ncbi:MAG: ferrochelatase [Dehalococcoidia bacterium]|nr:ferrochelatase [Dehalococcoidia bacterium]
MTVTKTGVLLMSFGSAANAGEVSGYLARVRGGRPAPDDLVTEFQRRYEVVGGSPLRKITADQAAALEALLNSRASAGEAYRVTSGMRYSEPGIADGLCSLADWGATRIAAIIMSPQYSPYFMGGYQRAVDAARPRLPAGVSVALSGSWHTEPLFTAAMAKLVHEGRAKFGMAERVKTIMTVHSLPKPMVEKEPEYLNQLRETASLVAARAALNEGEWEQAYQSAGHTPEEWLKPDFKDRLPDLKSQGYTAVLVVPVQFLADHLETLYDVDTAGGTEAGEAGMKFARSPAPNTLPLFIEALAAVAGRTLKQL